MLNKAIVIGRLVKDPELKQTPQGTSVCSFQIACARNYKDKDGETPTDFLVVVAWKGQAEFVARNFRKGNLIGVDGSIRSRNYEKDGERKTAIEIVGDSFFFVESKAQMETNEEDMEDLPF